MGRIFLDHIGGTRLFSCANCDTILTNRSELISTRFTGATGRAFLFNKVVNLQYSEVQDRVMLTGRHMVRDVSCKNCNSKLGWIYEFATEDSQRYKEGRVILERALVRESEGFEEHNKEGPVYLRSADMTEVMMSNTTMDDIRLSPSKDRLSYQIFPDPSDFERCCKLKDRLPSIVVEPTEGDVESGELRWPPEEYLVEEEQEEEKMCEEAPGKMGTDKQS
ncbi:UNVERIFIED_CONTAM: hypothetical protein FKN15_075904 [Acipenser sinensis]